MEKKSQLCKGCPHEIYKFHYNYNYRFLRKKLGGITFVPPPVHYSVAPSIKNYLCEDVIFIPFWHV